MHNTDVTRKRYDRIAPVYDLMEVLVEQSRFGKWRELLWSKVEGEKILEVGVGTGKNFPYYPADKAITAIDISEKMLGKARRKADSQYVKVNLLQMDAQNMTFEDAAFDSVAGTFVFCSVPDPLKGLREVARVTRPGGQVLLLEHVLSANRIIAGIMNLFNPLVVTVMGPNINRKTVETVAGSGLEVEKVTDLAGPISKIHYPIPPTAI